MPQGWVGYLRSGTIFPPSQSLIINGLKDAKKDADEKRRQAMELRVDLLRDDFLDQIQMKLGTQWEIENFTELYKCIDKSNNVGKRIITQISTLYDEPAAWKLSTDDGGVWDGLRKRSNLNLVMPSANQYTNLCNESLLFVCVIRGRLRYHLLTPDLVKVWQNPEDPTLFDAFAYQSAMVDTAEQQPVWHFWSNGGPGAPPVAESGRPTPTYAVLDMKDKVLHSEPNPYRDRNGNSVLPAVAYHRSYPVSNFWDQHSGDDIVDGTLMICGMETQVNYLFKVDAAQVKYVTGELAPSSMVGQVAGLQRLLTFRSTGDQKVDVGQFKSQSDWKGIRDLINDKINNLSTNYGLSAGALELSGTPQSGFALKVRKEPLLEIRKRQAPLFAASDAELYAVTAAVWNWERANNKGDPEERDKPALGKPMLWEDEADPIVSYGEYQEPKTVQERETELELDQVEMSMGLVNIIQLMQRRHPEMTLDQAEEAIAKNLEINRKLNAGTQLVIGRAQVLPIADQTVGAAAAQGGPPPPGASPGAPPPSPPPPVGPGGALPPTKDVQYDRGEAG